MNGLRILAIILLVFNGLSALVGGGILIIDPTGNSIQMPLSILEHSPFTDFTFPGILLFVFNGLLSLFTGLAAIKRYRHYHFLISLQGTVSIVWIVTQVIMIRAVVSLHYVYGGIGLALLFIGITLARLSKHNSK